MTSIHASQALAVVVGASGGLGAAFVEALGGSGRYRDVLALSRSDSTIDVTDEASIAAAASRAQAMGEPRLVIVATGVLHDALVKPEKSWNALDAETLARVFAVNSIGPALVAKHFLPLLPRRGRSVFAALSARVGSIEDNHLGGWYGYRASKAALNMLIKTLAIELSRRAPEALCVGLHPGTVDTRLSRPFQQNVAKEALFSPAEAAARLLNVIDTLSIEQTGGVFAWDGKRVPA